MQRFFPVLLIIFSMAGWWFATGSSKTQWVRLADVFLYGPYLTYLAFQTDYTFSMLEKVFLLLMGTTTITYNARNYLGNR
jgi:hypothetical protein